MQQQLNNDSNLSVTPTPDAPAPATAIKPRRQPKSSDDALEQEIAAEIEHGQLSEDELNSGNDI